MALGFAAGRLVRLGPGLYQVDLSQGFGSTHFASGLEKLAFECLYFLFSDQGAVAADPTLGTGFAGLIGSLSVGPDSSRVATLLADQIAGGEARIKTRQQGQTLDPAETLKRLLLDSVTVDATQGSAEIRLVIVNQLDQACGLQLPTGG